MPRSQYWRTKRRQEVSEANKNMNRETQIRDKSTYTKEEEGDKRDSRRNAERERNKEKWNNTANK